MTKDTSNRKTPVTHIYVARVTIEFETPFHVGTGDEGDISDAAVVSDVNGLPSLPGTSLAGMLRAAYAERFGADKENSLFGYQQQDEGNGSKLTVSWGCIHDQNNVPVEGLVDGSRLNDSVLANACNPTLRDHVRINHLGASSAEEHGKFDELAVCKGHRFTFECMLQGIDKDKKLWDNLIALLHDESLRIGGKTRRGFGAFRIVNLLARTFDLKDKADFAAFQKYPGRLDYPVEGFQKPLVQAESAGNSKTRIIHLTPCEYWMFGGGEDMSVDGFEVDMAPVRDRMIDWSKKPAVVKDHLVYLPGSSIKGALAHRTAYHYNQLTDFFSDQKSPEEFMERQTKNPGIDQLFGFAKEGKGDKSVGQRGRVLIDDVFIDVEPKSQVVHHVSIDRFTGGARSGGLFNERAFWQGPEIPINIQILESDQIDDIALEALDAAITDLCESRLALGGGTGRGLGFFKKVGDTGWKISGQEGGKSNG